DLNGSAAGVDYSATFSSGGGATAIVDSSNLTVTANTVAPLASATVKLTNAQDGASEVLDATVTGTSVTKAYDTATHTLTLTGSDTVAHFQQVLRSVTYNDSASALTKAPARTVTFVVNDGVEDSPVATSTVTVLGPHVAPVLDLNGSASGVDVATTFS